MFIKRQIQALPSIVIELKGAFVGDRCHEMANLLASICKQSAGQKLIINMREVDSLDAAGIGALVFVLKRLRATGGALGLCGVQSKPRQMLEALHLHRAIPMAEEVVLPEYCEVLEMAA